MGRTGTQCIEAVRECIGIPVTLCLILVITVGCGSYIIPSGQIGPCIHIIPNLISVHDGMFPTPSETFPTAYHESLGKRVAGHGTGYGSRDCSLIEVHGYITLVFCLRLDG